MIARRNPLPSAADGEPPSGLHLDAVRALVSEPGAWRALLHEERALSEFVERCRAVVDQHDRLALDHEELQLIHESMLEHANQIENDLGKYKEDKEDELALAKQVQQKLLPEPGGRLAVQLASQLEIAVYHRQAREVGGDYYDYFT